MTDNSISTANPRPTLARSIPFWLLVIASLASGIAGAMILSEKLGLMTTTLNDGTATGVEVYVGQSMAAVGAVLVGVGAIGLLLALTVATAASLRPAAPIEVIEPPEADSELRDPSLDSDGGDEATTGDAEPGDEATTGDAQSGDAEPGDASELPENAPLPVESR